ncbi:DUF4249 domain-containing protein [Roseivirga misakiensis]|uniref:DUF4249 domain-containing protein n=1 Tax=Roseivirga misakiensis TaxID=1563681 RepID=A0A1E5SZM7_9BACT|nr:DUF4249 domain-containing protein [Roseivirga misakiensis]OEK04559.1 hypothetical protein BFP71_13925 [Roseivirga misakiensis]
MKVKVNVKKGFKLISAILLIVCIACSEVIDLGGDPSSQFVLVYGRITDGTAGNEISLSLTSDRSDGAQQPISGATISLMSDNGFLGRYFEKVDSPGDYRLSYSDSAREGSAYHVVIDLPSGEQIVSEPAIMPGLAAKDSLSLKFELIDFFIGEQGFRQANRAAQLFVETKILEPNNDFYLKWNILESYIALETPQCCGTPPPPCYIGNDISGQEIKIFNGRDLTADVIPSKLFKTTKIDGRFAFIYYYSVIQTTLDEQAYNYWAQLQEIADLSGFIFDKTVANIQGNLYYPDNPKKQVFGYFEVARSDTTRISASSDEFSFFLRQPCPAAPESSAPECTACLLIENSSHHRPYYY